jgi:Flp pilus assembly protein TadD
MHATRTHGEALQEPAQKAWARAYGELGRAALRGGQAHVAVLAYRRATAIAPQWPTGWTNLGAVSEAAGDIPGAVTALQRAIELAPFAATPWVNFARLQRAHAGTAQARAVLERAAAAGIHDSRLDALARELANGEPPQR